MVAIIGLIATFAMASFKNAREKSRDTKRLADINEIQQALELYFLDQGSYPDEPAPSSPLGSTNTRCLNATGWQTAGCANAYMDFIPSDPRTGLYDYVYNLLAPNKFQIDFTLEHGMVGYPAGTCRGLPAVLINCP